jgi:hypothetical protein
MNWPIRKLDAAVRRANRKLVRLAFRRNSSALYLVAISWIPVLLGALLICGCVAAVASAIHKETVAALALIIITKPLIVVDFALGWLIRLRKEIAIYRRRFG